MLSYDTLNMAMRYPPPSDEPCEHPNRSGLTPFDLRVVVLVDGVEKVTKGGIILPEPTVDKEKYAVVKGTLVAAGANAFKEAKIAHPIPGDRVMIAKYGGIMMTNAEGEDYRLMNDEDIVGWLKE